MPSDPLGKDGKKLIRRLASSFGACASDARQYGSCVALHMESVQKDACAKEFEALMVCFRKEVAKARARGA